MDYESISISKSNSTKLPTFIINVTQQSQFTGNLLSTTNRKYTTNFDDYLFSGITHRSLNVKHFRNIQLFILSTSTKFHTFEQPLQYPIVVTFGFQGVRNLTGYNIIFPWNMCVGNLGGWRFRGMKNKQF